MAEEGRPSEYRAEFAAQAEKLCELGATDNEIAEFFGVSVRTIHRWKHDHEEFCHSIKAGKDKADERVVRSLYHKANGYDYVEEQAIKIKVDQYKEEVRVVPVTKHQPADTAAAVFWLKNRRKFDWRDRHEVTGEDGGPLQVVIRRYGED
ncbi:MAG TPA: helix-turn-helix domain-containing protein [Calditerricola sp.]